ncbi:hypothetical protein Lal_00012562, partial [Lupinus albus]
FTLHSENHIVLALASSGIASLLLSGEDISHQSWSHEFLPLKTLHATFIKETKLIIWDETPMIHKYCFEALDHKYHEFQRQRKFKFLWKIHCFFFFVILSVIPRGSHSSIINATLNSSYI